MTVLDLRYYPTTRGQFNYGTNLSSTLTQQKNWGGIMKPLSSSAVNLTKENIGFIEIWLQIGRAPADGTAKMIVDLGVVTRTSSRTGSWTPKTSSQLVPQPGAERGRTSGSTC